MKELTTTTVVDTTGTALVNRAVFDGYCGLLYAFLKTAWGELKFVYLDSMLERYA